MSEVLWVGLGDDSPTRRCVACRANIRPLMPNGSGLAPITAAMIGRYNLPNAWMVPSRHAGQIGVESYNRGFDNNTEQAARIPAAEGGRHGEGQQLAGQGQEEG